MRRNRERWLAQKHCPKGMSLRTTDAILRIPAALYDEVRVAIDGERRFDAVRQDMLQGDVFLLIMEQFERDGLVDITRRGSKREGGLGSINVTLRPRAAA